MTSQSPLDPEALEAAYAAYAELTVEEWRKRPSSAWRERLMEDVNISVSAYLAAAQPVVRGYIIVDKKTSTIDWDGELHPSIESAIESMTGPHQGMCRTAEEEDDTANDGREAWWRVYSIHAVTSLRVGEPND